MIDLPPLVQTILTAAGALVVTLIALLSFVIVSIPMVGRHLLALDPSSALGLRLVALGVDLRALGKTDAAKLFPPPIRIALQSIPGDSDPPAAPGDRS